MSWCLAYLRRQAPLISELVQWREIVENPERPSVRGRDQVMIFDDQVIDRHDWQVPLQRLPDSPSVKGDIDAGFRASIQQTASPWVLTDDTCKIVVRDAA